MPASDQLHAISVFFLRRELDLGLADRVLRDRVRDHEQHELLLDELVVRRVEYSAGTSPRLQRSRAKSNHDGIRVLARL